MTPFVNPAPLSAWMLAGFSEAYPHRPAISCSVDGGGRIRDVVRMADERVPDDRAAADRPFLGVRNRPDDRGCISRDAAEHFAIEVFENLRAALVPPAAGAGHLLSVLQRQDRR